MQHTWRARNVQPLTAPCGGRLLPPQSPLPFGWWLRVTPRCTEGELRVCSAKMSNDSPKSTRFRISRDNNRAHLVRVCPAK